MTPDMAVVTPLNNFLGPEGDTVTVDEQLLNTEYPRPPLTAMEDRRAPVTDASQSTTFRLYSSAAAPVTGAAAPRHPLPRCQGTQCRPGPPGILKYYPNVFICFLFG